jgi:hypothetical protein
MTKTQINCPNCRQPTLTDIEQIIDVGQDPGAKRRLLSGQANLLHCPHCGFQGMVATPLVYHDPEKELLLTFAPPDLGLSRDEQERQFGRLINQIVDRLPKEKRKGYLLNPQAVLTFKGLIERILQADGITPEMLEAQQKRLDLISRLLSTSKEARTEIVQQEDELIDAEFFSILGHLAQSAQANGDQGQVELLAELQKELLAQSSFGKQLKVQTEELEAAIQSLEEAGEGLSREKLLDLVIEAPSEGRLRALVSLARPGMDYLFFQQLTQRIEQAKGEQQKKLIALREQLLKLTEEVDQQMQARRDQVQQAIDRLVAADNLPRAIEETLPLVDGLFVQTLAAELEAAKNRGDKERAGKLEAILRTIQQITAPPGEYQFIEELLAETDEAALRKKLEANAEKVTPNFIGTLSAFLQQVKKSGDQELRKSVEALYLQAVQFDIERELE